MDLQFRQQVAAELSTMTVKELTEVMVVAGSILLKATGGKTEDPLFMAMLEGQELVLYAHGSIVKVWVEIADETIARFGGRKIEI